MLECFTKCKCFKCCFCLDHEIGVILVGVFYILVTVATCAWQYFEISIPMMYWQALSLIKNIGLIMGVRRKNVEYFLPWLVVIVVAILIGPFVIIGKFLQYKETRDDILGPVILGIGMPLYCGPRLVIRPSPPCLKALRRRWGITRCTQANPAPDSLLHIAPQANLDRGTKALALSHLLAANDVDVAVITEMELPPASAGCFAVAGYHTFLPLVPPAAKTRVLMLVKSDLAVRAGAQLRTDFMSTSVPTIWLELDLPGVRLLLIGGIYHLWSSGVAATSSSSSISGLGMEREELDIITHQLQSTTLAAKAVVVMGDFNLDSHRIEDKSYSRRLLLHSLLAGVEAAGLEY
eukprot:maker-scaffold10_size831480-snap-gene-7.21 protein:Tk01844 transcript:maker-scaffold10_size831480-snap-gene-7.21-mRNA-1 annotation:"exodeoxyribonuclease iii"